MMANVAPIWPIQKINIHLIVSALDSAISLRTLPMSSLVARISFFLIYFNINNSFYLTYKIRSIAFTIKILRSYLVKPNRLCSRHTVLLLQTYFIFLYCSK